MQDNNDMRRILEKLNKGDNMPKEKSSRREVVRKLREAAKQTPDYPPELKTATKAEYVTMLNKMDATGGGNDNGGGDEEPPCIDKIFQFLFLAITAISLFRHL